MEELLEIEIDCTERVNKETGEKFLSYRALSKKGYIDLRFTKEVANKPTHACKIIVAKDKVNVNRKSKFPVCWVSEIREIKEFEFTQNVSDYFA